METGELLKKVKEQGYSNLEDYVRANLHLVSKDKKDLFYSAFGRQGEHKPYTSGGQYAKG